MKTILYNKITGEKSATRQGYYFVDGIRPALPDHIVELEIIEQERPFTAHNEKLSAQWVIDVEGGQYRYEYILTLKTEGELIAEINSQADQFDSDLPAISIRELLQQQVEAEATTDADLLENKQVFQSYRVGKAYLLGEKFRWMDKLWKVLLSHTSQLDWLPTIAPSLYVEITEPGTIAAWKQPVGAHDAYQPPTQVTHNGFTWESTAENNVWEPGVYGWAQI